MGEEGEEEHELCSSSLHRSFVYARESPSKRLGQSPHDVWELFFDVPSE